MDFEHPGCAGHSGRSFLVIQLARFGDLVQTKRLVLSLQREGTVHLAVDTSLTALAALIYPQAVVHGICAHGRGGADLGMVHGSLLDLARLDFFRVYNLNFSGLNFALATLFPDDRVRGYSLRAGQRLIDFWPRQLMRWTRDRRIAGLNLVDAWGHYASSVIWPDEVNPVPGGRGGGLGVVMAGQNARRSLPANQLAPLVQAARARVGRGPVVLLGAGPERRAAQELTALLPAALRAEVRDLVGGTGWPELLDEVANLDLLLTPDTGTMHLAAHLGVPVMAFFLSSAWCHETGPYGAGHIVLQAGPDCAPCLETAPCPHDVCCRRFFSDTGVLRFVSGREGKGIGPGGRILSGFFDELGQDWAVLAGEDMLKPQRRAFRSLAASLCAVRGHALAASPEETWMQERDWMLPRTLHDVHHE